MRDRPLALELPIDRRERDAPRVEAELPLDRRSLPREEHEPAFAAALQSLSRKVAQQRDPADVLLEQAAGYEAAGDPASAFDALRASLLLRPMDARPVRDLERLAAGLQRRRVLAASYEEILRARPDHPGAAALGRRVEALRALADEGGETREPGAGPQSAPPAAEAPMLVAPRGAFEPRREAAAIPAPVTTGRWELATPEVDAPPEVATSAPVTPGPRRQPPPAPVARDPELLDAALARLPVTPGPAAAQPPRPSDSSLRVIHGRVAPLWRRLLAWIVDGVTVLSVPVSLVVLALRDVLAGSPLRVLGDLALRHGPVLGAAVALVAITGFVYLTLFGALGGRTVGDRLLGLRAVDTRSGRPPGLARAAVRALAAVVGTFAFLAGPLWALFDRRGQALHDKVGRTVTVVLEPAAAR